MARFIVTLFALLVITPAAADRVGYVRNSTPNSITEVRETVKDGKTVYVVTIRPSGSSYQVDRAPDGAAWQK